jgi:hypothetical protein
MGMAKNIKYAAPCLPAWGQPLSSSQTIWGSLNFIPSCDLTLLDKTPNPNSFQAGT